MKVKKYLAIVMAMMILFSQMSILQVNAAAFIDNEHWIESDPSALSTKFYADESFVAMFYRTTCPNSGTRKVAVESWMVDYGIDVYGVDVDTYSIPSWVWKNLTVNSVTLPIICIVNSSTELACFTAMDGMKQIQKYLYDYLGIYDDAEVDFSKLNDLMISRYSTHEATARALYSDTVEGGNRVTYQAETITAGITDDMEKLKAIYDWITANIYYDYGMLEGKRYPMVSAAQTLELGQSVCEGFANLTAAMCQAVGIPCRVVTGFAAGVGTESSMESVWETYLAWTESGDLGAFRQQITQYENHAWNEAYVDGRWVILDTTWGSNNDAVYLDEGYYYLISGIPDESYFDLSMDALSQSHLLWTDYSDDFVLEQESMDLMTVTGVLSAEDLAQTALGILAVYDTNGKMLFCEEAEISETVFSQVIPWNERATTVKLFLLDLNKGVFTSAYTGRYSYNSDC